MPTLGREDGDRLYEALVSTTRLSHPAWESRPVRKFTHSRSLTDEPKIPQIGSQTKGRRLSFGPAWPSFPESTTACSVPSIERSAGRDMGVFCCRDHGSRWIDHTHLRQKTNKRCRVTRSTPSHFFFIFLAACRLLLPVGLCRDLSSDFWGGWCAPQGRSSASPRDNYPCSSRAVA